MKFSLSKLILFCAVFFLQKALAEKIDYSPYPQPDVGYVSDYANLLSSEEETRLERWLLQVEEKSNVEIIVVTIRAMDNYRGTNSSSIESFATGLFNSYGIGNLPKNDGVLLLVSKEDRKARIELGKHYGRYRDIDAQDIMQNIIIPEFKRDNYGAGITDGTEAIIEEFAGMRITFPWDIIWLASAGIGCLLIGVSCIKNGKRGWGYVFIGLAIILILLALYLLRGLSKVSNVAGGSGGFGGGSSGGGGATGSW